MATNIILSEKGNSGKFFLIYDEYLVETIVFYTNTYQRYVDAHAELLKITGGRFCGRGDKLHLGKGGDIPAGGSERLRYYGTCI